MLTPCVIRRTSLPFANIFDYSSGEITRNMRSVGIDLQRWVKKNLLFENST
jgi:hypothetical protein